MTEQLEQLGVTVQHHKITSLGAYRPRGSKITQQKWRFIFLETVRKCEPEVLKSLSEEPMRLFREAGLDNVRRADLNVDRIFAWDRARRDWAKRWHLEDEWCLTAASETVEAWTHLPAYLVPVPQWGPSNFAAYFLASVPNNEFFHFDYAAWDFSLTKRNNYEANARRAFEAKLKAYCDRAQEVATSTGYEPVPTTKHTRKPLHFMEWLVQFRVQEWGLSRINKTYYPNSDNRNTIRKGINEANSLVGFPLYDFSSGDSRK